MKQSLGLLEAKGLLGAITAADAMVKAADIHVLGIEKTKGFGWMTVTICGDVGAVQAAIEIGSALLKSMNLYIAEKVIPRPAEGLEEVFCPREQTSGTPNGDGQQKTISHEYTQEVIPHVVTDTQSDEAKEIIAIIETKGQSVEPKEVSEDVKSGSSEPKGQSPKKKAPSKTKKTK